LQWYVWSNSIFATGYTLEEFSLYAEREYVKGSLSQPRCHRYGEVNYSIFLESIHIFLQIYELQTLHEGRPNDDEHWKAYTLMRGDDHIRRWL
jgi:hypothetical protein